MARGLSQLRNTALMAPISCSLGSDGKSLPIFALYSALNMLPLAERRMAREEFEDVAYFVPFYLKDFVAKQPRKLL